MDYDTIPPLPPALWNPNAAANWSLLFSPAFGAFIHARNAEALGRLEEAKANRNWFYVSLAFSGAALLSLFVPDFPDAPFNGVGIIILLLWYFTLAKKQATYVKNTYGSAYQKKTWGKPLLIGFACLVGFLGVTVALSVVVDHLYGIEAA